MPWKAGSCPSTPPPPTYGLTKNVSLNRPGSRCRLRIATLPRLPDATAWLLSRATTRTSAALVLKCSILSRNSPTNKNPRRLDPQVFPKPQGLVGLVLLFCSFEEIRQRELAAGAGVSIKFADGCGLLQSDTAGDDFGSSVTLGPDRDAGCTAQHRKLTDVRQRGVRSKKLIERSKSFKEPPDFRIPIACSLRTP